MSELVDQGADRDTRRRPCVLRTWCVEHDGHAPPCVEVPRAKHDAPDFGPRGKR